MRTLFLSGCAFGCTGGGQRPPQLALAAARAGEGVAYYSGVDKEDATVAGVEIYHDWDAVVNWALFGDPGWVVCCLAKYWPKAQELQKHGWRVAYDCLDNWDAFERHGDLTGAGLTHERELLDSAQVVTASAPALVARCGRLGRPDAHLVLQGGPSQPVPRKEAGGGLPQAIFVGSMWGSWIDWELMKLVGESKRLRTTIIGGAQEGVDVPGAVMLGEIQREEAIRYISAADVGIIPFRHRDICAGVDPVKVWEYAAAGLWTVATPEMEALADRDYVVLAGRGEFVEACLWAAAYRRIDPPSEAFVRSNSWDVRWQQVRGILEGAPAVLAPAATVKRKLTVHVSPESPLGDATWVKALRHLDRTHGPLDLRVGGEVLCPEGDCKAGFRSIYVDERGGVHRCERCPETLGTIMWPHLPGLLGKATPCDRRRA
jgi:hypothetical protein